MIINPIFNIKEAVKGINNVNVNFTKMPDFSGQKIFDFANWANKKKLDWKIPAGAKMNDLIIETVPSAGRGVKLGEFSDEVSVISVQKRNNTSTIFIAALAIYVAYLLSKK